MVVLLSQLLATPKFHSVSGWAACHAKRGAIILYPTPQNSTFTICLLPFSFISQETRNVQLFYLVGLWQEFNGCFNIPASINGYSPTESKLRPTRTTMFLHGRTSRSPHRGAETPKALNGSLHFWKLPSTAGTGTLRPTGRRR